MTTAVPVIAGIVNVPAAAAVLETVPVIVGLVNVPVVSVVLETATVPVITGLVVIPAVVLETATIPVIEVQPPVTVLVITGIGAGPDVAVVVVVVTTLTTDTTLTTHMSYPTTFVSHPVQSRPFLLPKCHPCVIS